MKLTNEDVIEVLQILDSSNFDELQVETRELKLTLRRSDDGEWTQSNQFLQSPNVNDAVIPEEKVAAGSVSAEEDTRGMVPVRASLLGTFYRAPSPGAAAFVEVGDLVKKDSVIGIIETMKLMNSVHAGVSGKVVDICAEDAAFVEQGSILMLFEPEGAEK